VLRSVDTWIVPFAVLGRWIGIAAVVFVIASPVHARSLSEILEGPEVCLAAPSLSPQVAPIVLADEQVLESMASAGQHWRIETERGPVHVWVPANYDPATAATIVFVHGYHIDVDQAWADYRLDQQFALSGINAMFIAPASPREKRSTINFPSLDGLLSVVQSNVDIAMPTKRLVIAGHSGAYRTLAVWLANQRLDTVVLLDAVYGEYSFVPWVREATSHRLVNIAFETDRFSDEMHRFLPSTVRVVGLPPEGFPQTRILYAKTTVGHYPLVTDGVALPLALRAIAVPSVQGARFDLPLGLPQRCEAIASGDQFAAE
jgi:hypothetical protein